MKIVLFVAAMLIFGMGLTYVGVIQKQHESEIQEIKSRIIAQNVQREINGSRAMLYAACSALHQREISEAKKWTTVTNIEVHYPQPHHNSIDSAYHSARRKALSAAKTADNKIAKFNCLESMEAAYRHGARTDALPTPGTHYK